jgi:hypothetical protein
MRMIGTLLSGIVIALALASTGCPPAPVPAPTVPVDTTPKTGPLESRIFAAIELAKGRQLNVSHGFWTIFHGILGLGPAFEIFDPVANKQVNALDYIRLGGKMEGLRFDYRGNGIDVFTADDIVRFFAQGHQDQFVAEMAQWGVPKTLPFKVDGKDYTFADFVAFTKYRASVTRKQELAWALLIIAEYDGTNVAWTNQFNEAITLEDIVRYENDSPMDPDETNKIGQLPLACGGTHRLYGLSWALHVHLEKGGKLTGVWKKLSERLEQFKKTAKLTRNEDGSLSTNYMVKKGHSPMPVDQLSTTGHTFEWLALSLSDKELREPWVEEAASRLATLFSEVKDQVIDGGAMYHAVHGLLIYYARVFGTEKLGPYTPYVRLAPGCKPVIRPGTTSSSPVATAPSSTSPLATAAKK